MKVLVTNNHMDKLGGSETFTYAFAAELKRLGHSVSLFTFKPGYLSDKLAVDHGIKNVFAKTDFDVVFANHNTCVQSASMLAYTIQTCHGTIPKLEQPSPLANAYVAISEEVAFHVKKITSKQADVIVNGIDCKRFKPIKPISKKVRKILSLAQSEEFNNDLAQRLKLFGVELISFNKFTNPVWHIESIINEVDMVVSLGRGAYEAMACGRPVLVMDKRPYQEIMGDGLINPENYNELVGFNCSGRATRNANLEYLLSQAIDNYSPELGYWCRENALKNHNIELQTQKYLQLWKKSI